MIPNTNEITAFAHCCLCLEEMGATEIGCSPREYAELEVGFTDLGLQIWCKRHECNILHIDFEGHRHPTNDSRIGFPKLREV